MLMVSPVTIEQWVSKGWLKSQVTAGGHRRFSQFHVETFAQQQDIALNLGNHTGLRILIVDDDRQAADFLTEYFSKHPEGVETDIAHDGFEAGQKASEFEPDVILLDLMMPGLNGFDVCNRLKSNPATATIDIIAMTGYHTPDNVDRILNAGAKACLAKPLDMAQLLRELGLSSFT